MKVLLIGGTGFIGKKIAECASQKGHEVVLFNRGIRNPEPAFKTIKGDVEELQNYESEFHDLQPDVVVHCIAYTEKHSTDLVSIFKDFPTRLIVLGSCDCYEAFQGLNRGFDAGEFPITEKSQLSKTRYYWRDIGKRSFFTS